MGEETPSRALVATMLRQAAAFPWRMQEIGLMSLRLDERREYRLHGWDSEDVVGAPPVHDHPYDFTSTVIAGELTNALFDEDPAGDEYVRCRYSRAPRKSGRSTRYACPPRHPPSRQVSATDRRPTSSMRAGNCPGP